MSYSNFVYPLALRKVIMAQTKIGRPKQPEPPNTTTNPEQISKDAIAPTQNNSAKDKNKKVRRRKNKANRIKLNLDADSPKQKASYIYP